MAPKQLELPYLVKTEIRRVPTQERLVALLCEDLDFHDRDSGYASHNFHSFPAKFPPQLPRKFIEGLTNPGDCVLDPMVGSGTTVVEAYLAGRQGLGFDIDPLAVLISTVKSTPVHPALAAEAGHQVLQAAKAALRLNRQQLEHDLETRWDPATHKFVNYWFHVETQLELLALITEINKLTDPAVKRFCQLVFSSIIVTKSGGVSLAFDLAHTRPHRAKFVVAKDSISEVGPELLEDRSPRDKLLTKTLRSAVDEFGKRLERDLRVLQTFVHGRIPALVQMGDAQSLPLRSASVDLIVTSPPYAVNAIDYMRAHKFSLVWLGHPINELSQKRKEYIGGEAMTQVMLEPLPELPARIVAEVSALDAKRGQALHRYYSEMTRSLREMQRVLRPDRAAIVVVGNSVIRGHDTQTGVCLAEIGKSVGLEVCGIGVRNLDRDRRMLPARARPSLYSQIEQRMHQESVIAFYRPCS